LSGLSKAEWEEWQGNPVTVLVRDSLARLMDRKRKAFQAAWFSGNPPSEAHRLALVALAEWHEDFFTATHDELMAAMEQK
jgi:hypothetical protein